MMSDHDTSYSHDEIVAFGHKLSDWAARLDDTQKAMLIDLLAKAGGDVYGNDMASHLTTPDDTSSDASALSPLEYEDYVHTVEGIFGARQELQDAIPSG